MTYEPVRVRCREGTLPKGLGVNFRNAEAIINQNRALCVKYEGKSPKRSSIPEGFKHFPKERVICKGKPSKKELLAHLGRFCDLEVDAWTASWIDGKDTTRTDLQKFLSTSQERSKKPLRLSTFYPQGSPCVLNELSARYYLEQCSQKPDYCAICPPPQVFPGAWMPIPVFPILHQFPGYRERQALWSALTNLYLLGMQVLLSFEVPIDVSFMLSRVLADTSQDFLLKRWIAANDTCPNPALIAEESIDTIGKSQHFFFCPVVRQEQKGARSGSVKYANISSLLLSDIQRQTFTYGIQRSATVNAYAAQVLEETEMKDQYLLTMTAPDGTIFSAVYPLVTSRYTGRTLATVASFLLEKQRFEEKHFVPVTSTVPTLEDFTTMMNSFPYRPAQDIGISHTPLDGLREIYTILQETRFFPIVPITKEVVTRAPFEELVQDVWKAITLDAHTGDGSARSSARTPRYSPNAAAICAFIRNVATGVFPQVHQKLLDWEVDVGYDDRSLAEINMGKETNSGFFATKFLVNLLAPAPSTLCFLEPSLHVYFARPNLTIPDSIVLTQFIQSRTPITLCLMNYLYFKQIVSAYSAYNKEKIIRAASVTNSFLIEKVAQWNIIQGVEIKGMNPKRFDIPEDPCLNDHMIPLMTAALQYVTAQVFPQGVRSFIDYLRITDLYEHDDEKIKARQEMLALARQKDLFQPKRRARPRGAEEMEVEVETQAEERKAEKPRLNTNAFYYMHPFPAFFTLFWDDNLKTFLRHDSLHAIIMWIGALGVCPTFHSNEWAKTMQTLGLLLQKLPEDRKLAIAPLFVPHAKAMYLSLNYRSMMVAQTIFNGLGQGIGLDLKFSKPEEVYHQPEVGWTGAQIHTTQKPVLEYYASLGRRFLPPPKPVLTPSTSSTPSVSLQTPSSPSLQTPSSAPGSPFTPAPTFAEPTTPPQGFVPPVPPVTPSTAPFAPPRATPSTPFAPPPPPPPTLSTPTATNIPAPPAKEETAPHGFPQTPTAADADAAAAAAAPSAEFTPPRRPAAAAREDLAPSPTYEEIQAAKRELDDIYGDLILSTPGWAEIEPEYKDKFKEWLTEQLKGLGEGKAEEIRETLGLTKLRPLNSCCALVFAPQFQKK